MPQITPKILAFDVFGTVVDWHGSIAAEVRQLYPQVDGDALALAWREGYQPAMQRVRSGELGFGLGDLPENERRALNRVWHRLNPWPDVVEGLSLLKRRHVITTLSNGNIGLLTNMAKHGGLPWDCVLSAEVFRAYKPDARVYLGVAEVFDVAPHEVMMVAAHQDDLAAARDCGLLTAYIERPLEFGAARPKDVSPAAENTLHARDLIDLARQLALDAVPPDDDLV